jgi:hypothetical protein
MGEDGLIKANDDVVPVSDRSEAGERLTQVLESNA